MSLRNRLVLPVVALLFLTFMAACGGSPTHSIPAPPPTGAFSDSNLNGTYVFSVTGSDAVVGGYQAIVGTLMADGNGNINAGTFDINNPGNNGVLLGLTVASGSKYSVTSDGRGTANVNVSGGGSLGFDFVLTSKTGGGLITEFDGNGTGSGTLDLQTSNAISATNYSFNFSGTSGINTSLCGDSSSTGGSFVIPFATVGTFTLGSGGSISGGTEDAVNNCVSIGGTSGLAITGGSVSPAPATSTISSGVGTFLFHVYPIDGNHLKFIEIDSAVVVAGDAFPQSSTIPTNNVFTVAGFDIPAFGPFTAAGLIVTDGNGNVTSASAEDINDISGTTGSGVASEVTGYTGAYTAVSGGRSLLTLTNFANGAGGVLCGASGTPSCQFAIYPSSGGLQILEVDSLGTTGGIAYAQNGSPVLASGQGYGMNLSGSNLSAGAEEDDIAEFTYNSSNTPNIKGIIDFNDQGSTSLGQGLTSVYTADGTVPGRGTVSANGSKNAYDYTAYVVDSSTAVCVVTDSNMIALGSLGTQNASVNAAAQRLAVLQLRPGAKSGLKRRK